MQDQKTKAISEIVKIIEECRYNDELAQGYKREIYTSKKYMTRGAKSISEALLYFFKTDLHLV